MKVKDITFDALISKARSDAGLSFDIGPFVVRLRTQDVGVLRNLSLLYEDFDLAQQSFVDFHVDMKQPVGLRRWFRPQILFSVDGHDLFEPFPLSHALPLFEWGLNWCIARRAHQYLMLHSAVVEKMGKAIIFPAFPGAGKSTLSAALGRRGWRFLSDEFGLVRAEDGLLQPMPRPVPLKNESIQVIREFSSTATIGPLFPKTRKGTVAHLKSPSPSVDQCKQLAKPALVIFPRYQKDSEILIQELPKHSRLRQIGHSRF
nr:HprK-related kinase A [Methylomarinum sp. Ch1-1]MDP4521225.1 HprK-related kinase A [Methylomarinum sp. Ch1-1]